MRLDNDFEDRKLGRAPSSVSEKDRIAALAAGMDAFEEKPIFIDKLFETIGRFLHPEG